MRAYIEASATLHIFYIRECGLKQIKREDLNGLENLTCLEITDCKLSTLHDDLFVNMKSLTVVNFRGNQIEFATSKVLEPFIGRKMHLIDLRFNNAVDSCVDPSGGIQTSIEDLMEEIDDYCCAPVIDKPRTINQKKTSREAANYFHGKFGELWTSGRYSDLTIIVGAMEFRVHKNILAIQSQARAKPASWRYKTSVSVQLRIFYASCTPEKFLKTTRMPWKTTRSQSNSKQARWKSSARQHFWNFSTMKTRSNISRSELSFPRATWNFKLSKSSKMDLVPTSPMNWSTIPLHCLA